MLRFMGSQRVRHDRATELNWCIFSGGSAVKNLSAMQEMQETLVQYLSWEDALEKEMATHSSILAGKSHGQRSLAGFSLWSHNEFSSVHSLSRIRLFETP